jgi:hypothetical protein
VRIRLISARRKDAITAAQAPYKVVVDTRKCERGLKFWDVFSTQLLEYGVGGLDRSGLANTHWLIFRCDHCGTSSISKGLLKDPRTRPNGGRKPSVADVSAVEVGREHPLLRSLQAPPG